MAHVRKTEILERRDPDGIAGSDGARRERHLTALGDERRQKGLRLEEVVGAVLRYGSLLSMALIVPGIAALAWALHSAPQRYTGLLTPGASSASVLHTPGQILSGLDSGNPLAILSLGLLVLIATPVLRVASTVLYFLWKGDRVYLAITSFVLLVLLVGFAVGSTG